ncbi:MAG: hypothetical protein U0133_10960 [Gemmatimonadales bacterium]
MHTTVENDEIRQVDNDRTTTIKNNETKTVTDGDEVHKVEKGKHRHHPWRRGDDHRDREAQPRGPAGRPPDHRQAGSRPPRWIPVTRPTSWDGEPEERSEDGNIDTKAGMGNISTKADMGNISTEASMGNISTEAKLGNISIKADREDHHRGAPGHRDQVRADERHQDGSQRGADSGLMTKVEGTVQTQVKGLITQVTADVMPGGRRRHHHDRIIMTAPGRPAAKKPAELVALAKLGKDADRAPCAGHRAPRFCGEAGGEGALDGRGGYLAHALPSGRCGPG